MKRASSALFLVLAVGLFLPVGASAQLNPVASFGSAGEGAGQIQEPGGVALASDGKAYIADYGNERIAVFGADRNFLYAFGKEVNVEDDSDVCTAASGCQAGSSGEEAGQLDKPENIGIGASGKLFVADLENNRIDVFSEAGAFLYAFGKEVNVEDGSDVCTVSSECQVGDDTDEAGSMFRPSGIGVASERVYVADQENNRIDVFSEAGAFLYAFGKEVNDTDDSDVCTEASGCVDGYNDGEAGAMGEPYDVKPQAGGLLVVADSENDRVDVFTVAGDFVRAFGKEVNVEDDSDVCTAASGCRQGLESEAAGGLNDPTAIAAGPGGEVDVADNGNDRIAQFRTDGSFVRAFGFGVVDGAAEFQVCSRSTGCVAGAESEAQGAISDPYGVAIDASGDIYAVEEHPDFARVEIFRESAPPTVPVTSAAPLATPANSFKFGKVKLNRKKGVVTLRVRVPGPGSLVLKGKGVKKAKRRAKSAGIVKLVVKPVGKTRKRLAKKGKVKVTAKVTFTPDGGAARTQQKKLTLKKKVHKKQKKQRQKK